MERLRDARSAIRIVERFAYFEVGSVDENDQDGLEQARKLMRHTIGVRRLLDSLQET